MENCNGCEGCPAFKKSFLSDLSGLQIKNLKDNAIALSFRKGQDITIRDTTSQGVFCIHSGTVKNYLKTPQGENITLSLRTTGDMFGHQELMGHENIFSSGCLTDVGVCFFPKKMILKKLERTPALSKKIMAGLNADLAEMGSYLLALSYKSIRQRTAQAILYLQEKTGNNTDGTIALQLPRQELANMVGASRESVHRELAFFKKKKWIDLKGQHFLIIDEERIRKQSAHNSE